ncbi:MAG: AAA family ATPase [Ardenticatenales bacterium]|nr:AAA family ATPase [Ardenticatenales bacterium]
MLCPRCSTTNPANAKFCLNCGTTLANRCATCQMELPANARFCFNCGQPVSAVTPVHVEEASAPSLAAPILSGERKIVTALFADVVGSTALTEQVNDAEDWTSIMNGAFDRFSPVVSRYGGNVSRLLGDAMLALFGAPVAHEDDPVRAIHAAMELLEVTREYAVEVKERYGIPFEIRIGINTGPAVVGPVGNDLKSVYTAMGDAVNLASRMQSAARPMTTLISEHTYRFVAPLFDVADLGRIEVKGKSEPVQVYEVRGSKAQPGRLRGLAGLESPMVGRDRELAALLSLNDAIPARQGGAALVIGEPGIGKSRLIGEWKAAVSAGDQPPQWAEGHCLSYGQGLAYHLLIDLLRSVLGVPATANESETRVLLRSRLEELFDGALLEVYPYLGHLLSLQLEEEAREPLRLLDPQALQAQYLATLRRLLLTLSAQRPLILILDDIHWADPSSTELLVRLLPLVAEAPILFCFVTRPDQDSAGWRLVPIAREQLGEKLVELSLRALSESDSRQLVSNLLEIEELPEIVRTTILRKAEGNPFFVEEVIRMLIDRGAIVQEAHRWVAQKEIEVVEIPDTLQGLLLARIDRLPEDVKHTLRVASVIGRQFSVKVLEQVLNQKGAG